MKVLAGATAAFIAGVGGGLLAVAQTTVSPSSFATFAGIVWFAALVTIGIRSTAAALVAALAFVMLPAISQAYLPTWTGNLLPVIFGLGAISAAKYPDGVLAEQSRRLRHLLQRVAPDALADEHFAEEVEAGVVDTEAVGMAPEVAGQLS
jgi:branched-chain amino acid transport system permease protein